MYTESPGDAGADTTELTIFATIARMSNRGTRGHQLTTATASSISIYAPAPHGKQSNRRELNKHHHR